MAETLLLEGKLDIAQVAQLHHALATRLDADLQIDFARVTQIGALCLQTLIAAGRAIRAAGHKLMFANINEIVLAQFHAMGCAPGLITEGRI